MGIQCYKTRLLFLLIYFISKAETEADLQLEVTTRDQV